MPSKKIIDYQKVRAELDVIIMQLESGELGIDEAVKQYQRGEAIIKQLQDYLKHAENTVKKVRSQKS